MANREAAAGTAPQNGEAPKRRRRAASGPRKPSSVHAIFHVTDDNGETIPGAKVKIVHQSKSAEKALEFLDSNQGKGYVRHKIIVKDTDSDAPAAEVVAE